MIVSNEPVVSEIREQKPLIVFRSHLTHVREPRRFQRNRIWQGDGALRRIYQTPALRWQAAFRAVNARGHVVPRKDDRNKNRVSFRTGVNFASELRIFRQHFEFFSSYGGVISEPVAYPYRQLQRNSGRVGLGRL